MSGVCYSNSCRNTCNTTSAHNNIILLFYIILLQYHLIYKGLHLYSNFLSLKHIDYFLFLHPKAFLPQTMFFIIYPFHIVVNIFIYHMNTRFHIFIVTNNIFRIGYNFDTIINKTNHTALFDKACVRNKKIYS